MLYKVYIRRGLPRTVNTWLFASSLVEACVTDWVSFVNGNSLRPSRAPNAYKVDSVRLSRVETFCGTSFWSNTAAAASWNRRAVVWKRLVGAAAAARLTSPRVSVETLQLLLCTMEYLSPQSNNLFYILFEAWQVVCRKGETQRETQISGLGFTVACPFLSNLKSAANWCLRNQPSKTIIAT